MTILLGKLTVLSTRAVRLLADRTIGHDKRDKGSEQCNVENGMATIL
jgi:hypothetical protein